MAYSKATASSILISTYIAQFKGCVMGRIHYGLKFVFCLDILLPPIIIIIKDYSQA